MSTVAQTPSGFLPYGYSLCIPDIPATSNKVRIQNRLVLLGKTGIFFPVTYEPVSDLSPNLDPSDSEAIPPAVVLCNETRSTFSTDPRMGRRYSRKRTSWVFELIIEFNQEVSCEFFEHGLIDTVIILPPDKENGLPNTFLELNTNSSTHPVKQGSAKGSRFVFAFTATEGRI